MKKNDWNNGWTNSKTSPITRQPIEFVKKKVKMIKNVTMSFLMNVKLKPVNQLGYTYWITDKLEEFIFFKSILRR